MAVGSWQWANNEQLYIMKNMIKIYLASKSFSIRRPALIYFLTLSILLISASSDAQPAKEVLNYLKSLGNGSWLFGQMATWVHNENPDMDNPGNWIKKVYDHTGKLPKYGCITYDFADDPFTDSEWNEGVRKLWNKGMIVGVFSFYANPTGGKCTQKTGKQLS